MPRPPEMTILAEVRSTWSLSDSACETHFDRPVSSPPLTGSIAALPPSAAAASNLIVRTVMTLILSADCTVASALPA